MDFTRDACWFLFLKSLLIKNNKKREAALRNETGGDEKHVFFFTWPKRPMVEDDHPIRLRKEQSLQGNERSLQHATGK